MSKIYSNYLQALRVQFQDFGWVFVHSLVSPQSNPSPLAAKLGCQVHILCALLPIYAILQGLLTWRYVCWGGGRVSRRRLGRQKPTDFHVLLFISRWYTRQR